ncbi:hypothetical protein AB0A69_09740 [Streptomyces sp. NPDC045431]|uniref:hypothetical protein n=1 Tax=Streptomyces sp. NPDC045431 TaxID=3155613 RepID=UPI0034056984
MLRHVIAPVRRYTKVSHDVVRHPYLNSDAKILLIHVQGLPDGKVDKPLSEHAAELGLRPRAYQKAKRLLVEGGFVHEWQFQDHRGRWATEQLCSNVTLTREEAARVRDDVPEEVPPVAPPSAPEPTVGESAPRVVGGSPPEDEDGEKNDPHRPPKAPAPAPAPASAPELAQAERVLLSLRHTHPDLLLGVREARGLADAAAEWLRRGLSASELHRALTSGLPPGGVRSAVGFLRHRLVEKLPVAAEAAAGPRQMVVCEGPGDEHLFRPVGDETQCGRCRQAAAAAAAPRPAPSWRALVAREASAGA